MDILYDFFIKPFVDIVEFPIFFIEVVVGGLLSGVMYSLVALGFVLIFKASGMVNFAQGYFVLFAAMTLVGLMAGATFGVFWWIIIILAGLGFHWSVGTGPEKANLGRLLLLLAAILAVVRSLVGVGFAFEVSFPLWAAVPLTILVMIGLAFAVERTMLRYLVNQDHIILFMATIGLAFFMEGFGETIWGSDVRALDIGLPSGPLEIGGVQMQKDELGAGIAAALLVTVLAVFFQKTRIGRALRAVADDHQAALSVGINLRTIWIIVWSVAGIVALVAGIVWGSKSGVQFSLALIALKALPVLILGGFTSVPGAIVGGLIIGLGEKVFEVYWGPAIGGATENWFAYVLALVFLLFRPQGLFGEKIIERV